MRYAMIMAGGSGTRLWPMSRRDRPKQMLPLIDGRSLLGVAAGRLEGLIDPSHRLICTAEKFRAAIGEQMPDFTDEQILGEPAARDTVNAVGLTAAVLAKRDPDAVFIVLTADHLIEPVDEFQAKLRTGMELVEEDPRRFVTFAIHPTHAATGYGYVERGTPIPGHADSYAASAFKEKPDAATAEQYLQAGTFAWNSGMFVFNAATFLETLERFLPDSWTGLDRIADAWDTPTRDDVLRAFYPTLPKISVDYAIMEPAADDPTLSICVVEMNVQWRDIGSWPSFADCLEADADKNRASAHTAHVDSHNIVAISEDPDHTIAAIGCEDLIIVHTADATLVCRVADAEKVKELAGRVDERLQ